MKKHNPSSIAQPMGAYANGVSAPGGGRWLYVAGQIGVDKAGQVPQDFAGQAHNAWTNLVAILADAGMDVGNLVKVTHYLVDEADLPAYNPVRSQFLGDARPASTLVIAKALARPQWRVEVEAIAWRA